MASKVTFLLLLGCLLASLALTWAVQSGTDSSSSLQSVIIGQVRARVTNGNSTTTTPDDQQPCDLTTNACMDWCGETVRRPGLCPDNQMCCLLIY